MKKKLASLPTQVSLSVILNPLGHLPRQRNEPAVFTQSSPKGHDPVPSAHSSTSGKKRRKLTSLRTPDSYGNETLAISLTYLLSTIWTSMNCTETLIQSGPE